MPDMPAFVWRPDHEARYEILNDIERALKPAFGLGYFRMDDYCPYCGSEFKTIDSFNDPMDDGYEKACTLCGFYFRVAALSKLDPPMMLTASAARLKLFNPRDPHLPP